jgi:ubiquinone/menaquinone biosynthesis C-methylase UbiE
VDPLAGSAWSEAGTVAGFAQSAPNPTLIQYAARLQGSSPRLRVLDIGCGAGRNAVPLARAGAYVIGTDLSWPMLRAAADRDAGDRLHLALAPMHALPVRDRCIDLIVAHGIWNLARSDREFRQAIAEAARVACPGAALFVFTFSRHTLPADAMPLTGQTLTFTQFSGSPQIFVTAEQLAGELRAGGFEADPDLQLRELNLPPPGQCRVGGAPVIYEAGFRYSGA